MARSKTTSSTSDETSTTPKLPAHMEGNKNISSCTPAIEGDENEASEERSPMAGTHTSTGNSDRPRGVKRKLAAPADNERQTRLRDDDEQHAAAVTATATPNETPPLVPTTNNNDENDSNNNKNINDASDNDANNSKNSSNVNSNPQTTNTTPPMIAEDENHSNNNPNSASSAAAVASSSNVNHLLEQILYQRRVLLHRTKLCRNIIQNRLRTLNNDRHPASEIKTETKTSMTPSQQPRDSTIAAPTENSKTDVPAATTIQNTTATSTDNPYDDLHHQNLTNVSTNDAKASTTIHKPMSALAQEEHQHFLNVTRQALQFAANSKKQSISNNSSQTNNNAFSSSSSSSSHKKISRASARRTSSGMSRKYHQDFVTDHNVTSANASSSVILGNSNETTSTSTSAIKTAVTTSKSSSVAAAAAAADHGKTLLNHSNSKASNVNSNANIAHGGSMSMGKKSAAVSSLSSSSYRHNHSISHSNTNNTTMSSEQQYTAEYMSLCQDYTRTMNLLITQSNTSTTANTNTPYHIHTGSNNSTTTSISSSSVREFGGTEMLPMRRKTHWDILLEEMLYVATDYHQERVWKQCMSKNMIQHVSHLYQTGAIHLSSTNHRHPEPITNTATANNSNNNTSRSVICDDNKTVSDGDRMMIIHENEEAEVAELMDEEQCRRKVCAAIHTIITRYWNGTLLEELPPSSVEKTSATDNSDINYNTTSNATSTNFPTVFPFRKANISDVCTLEREIQMKIDKSRKAEVTKYNKLYQQCGAPLNQLLTHRSLQVTRRMDVLLTKTAPHHIGLLYHQQQECKNPSTSLDSIAALIWRYHSLGPILLIAQSYSLPYWRCMLQNTLVAPGHVRLYPAVPFVQDVAYDGVSILHGTNTNAINDITKNSKVFGVGDVVLCESHTLQTNAVQNMLQCNRFGICLLDARCYPSSTPITNTSAINGYDENLNMLILPHEYQTDSFWRTMLYQVRYLLQDDDNDLENEDGSNDEEDGNQERIHDPVGREKENYGRVQRVMMVDDESVSYRYKFSMMQESAACKVKDVYTEWCIPGYYQPNSTAATTTPIDEDDIAMEVGMKNIDTNGDAKDKKCHSNEQNIEKNVDYVEDDIEKVVHFCYPSERATTESSVSSTSKRKWTKIMISQTPRQRDVYNRICTWVRGALATRHIASTSIASALLRLRRVCFTCEPMTSTSSSAFSGNTTSSSTLEKVLSGSGKLCVLIQYLVKFNIYTPADEVKDVIDPILQLVQLSTADLITEEVHTEVVHSGEEQQRQHVIVVLASNPSTLQHIYYLLHQLLGIECTLLLPSSYSAVKDSNSLHTLDWISHQRTMYEFWSKIVHSHIGSDMEKICRVLLCTPYHLDPALHGTPIPTNIDNVQQRQCSIHILSLDEDWSGRGDAVYARLHTKYSIDREGEEDEEEEADITIRFQKLVISDSCEPVLVYTSDSENENDDNASSKAYTGIASRVLSLVKHPLQDVLQCDLNKLMHQGSHSSTFEAPLFLPAFALEPQRDNCDSDATETANMIERIKLLKQTILHTEHTHGSSFLYPNPNAALLCFPPYICTAANPGRLRLRLIYAPSLARYLNNLEQQVAHQNQLVSSESAEIISSSVNATCSPVVYTYKGSLWDLLVYDAASVTNVTSVPCAQKMGAAYTEPLLCSGILQTYSPIIESSRDITLSKVDSLLSNADPAKCPKNTKNPMRLRHIPTTTSRERYTSGDKLSLSYSLDGASLDSILLYPAPSKHVAITSSTNALLHDLHRVHLIRQHSDLVWAAVLQRIHTSLSTPSVPLSSNGNEVKSGITLPMGVRVRHIESAEGAVALVAWWRQWDDQLVRLVQKFCSSTNKYPTCMDCVNWNLVASTLGDGRVSARQCRARYKVLIASKTKQQQKRKRSLSDVDGKMIESKEMMASSEETVRSSLPHNEQQTKHRLLHLRQSANLAHPAPTIPHTTTLLTTAHNSHEASVQAAVHSYLSEHISSNSVAKANNTDTERLKAMQGEMWPLQLLDLADRRRTT